MPAGLDGLTGGRMSRSVKIGMAGLGTVGSGLAKILLEKGGILAERAGVPLELKRVCVRNPDAPRQIQLPPGILTTDLEGLVSDPDIDIFVELIGGLEPARSCIIKAIEGGKHVVTANKAVLATCGWEIFRLADQKGCCVAFEASVAGGIPVIEVFREGLPANRISRIIGILNGTSNYILSEMSSRGEELDTVLKKAQEKGYAEADPTYDIDGTDAAHKLAVLASLAFQAPVEMDAVSKEGIEAVERFDLEMAAELGFVVKLLAVASRRDEGLDLRVHPAMIPAGHLLARVSGVYNAIYVTGDAVGEILLHGLGAGQMPTGSAVAADVVALARRIASGCRCSASMFLGFGLDGNGTVEICPREALESRFYIRFNAQDRPGVLAAISGILGSNGISIESVVQRGRAVEGGRASVPIVMLTHAAPVIAVEKAVEEIEALEVVAGKSVMIRVEELE